MPSFQLENKHLSNGNKSGYTSTHDTPYSVQMITQPRSVTEHISGSTVALSLHTVAYQTCKCWQFQVPEDHPGLGL